MNESTKNNILKVQKLMLGLCAVTTIFPMTELAIGIYRNDTKAIQSGLVGTALCGMGTSLTSIGLLANPYRKKERG